MDDGGGGGGNGYSAPPWVTMSCKVRVRNSNIFLILKEAIALVSLIYYFTLFINSCSCLLSGFISLTFLRTESNSLASSSVILSDCSVQASICLSRCASVAAESVPLFCKVVDVYSVQIL